MAKYEAVPCKHCGRILGHTERSVASEVGLDSDECPNNVRCQVEVHGAESPIGQAYQDLRALQTRWAARESAAERAEAAEEANWLRMNGGW